MFRATSRGKTVRLVVIGALIVSLYVVVPAAVSSLLPKAQADQPISGAFSLGNGLGGSIDPRTGQFSSSIPLVDVASRGHSSVSFALGWEQSRAGAEIDRFGWGNGWGMSTTYVDSGVVYPASGGAYPVDTRYDSGLRYYQLKDLVYDNDASGTLPPLCPSCSPVAYTSTLTYTNDGRVDYFSAPGNLVSRQDRYQNRTDLSYEQVSPRQWRPTAIIDAFGLRTTFAYPSTTTMTVSSPKRSDGVTATATVLFDKQQRVQTVTDPVGQRAEFGYGDAPGTSTEYLTSVSGSSGAQAVVAYQEIDPQGILTPLIAVDTLKTFDPAGSPLGPDRTFEMAAGDPSNHNYAGYPDFQSATTDALFESGSTSYTYSTEISNPYTSTKSTFDSGHRLTSREIQVAADDGNVTVQTQNMTYPPLGSNDANFARPLTSAVTHHSRSDGGGFADAGNSRTEKTTTAYDDNGRIQEGINSLGTSTKTTYDDTYGVVTSVVVTGKDGARRSTVNTLTPDKKSILTSTQSVAGPGGDLSSRNKVTYDYDGFGQPKSRIVEWVAGAAPPDNGGGPASSTTTYTITEDPAAVTRRVTTAVAPGTPAARTTTAVFDLVSHQPIRTVDGAGRATTRSYDAAGRVTALTPPTGLTTRTAYSAADPDGDPATQTVTGADGHVTRTTYDALGRKVSVSDNVRNGAFTSDPGSRMVSSASYSPDGTTVTSTDMAGRKTTSVSDALGRPLTQISANGVTKTTAYNDVTNTTTTRTFGDNATGPSQVDTDTFDALGRAVRSRTTYPYSSGGRPFFLTDPLGATTYDGIGRESALASADLEAVPTYDAAGGVESSTVLSPAGTAPKPGEPITSTSTTMLDASPTLRSLQQPGQPARPGVKLVYDAAGNVTSSTDGLGRITRFTYTPDGRPATRTSPSGIVTTNVYDPATGRLTSASSKAANGTPDPIETSTTYTYVAAGQPGAGLVRTVTNESGTITYGYDADANRISVRYPDGAVVSSDYTDSGLLHTTTDATGALTTYVYNTDSSLKSATQRRGTTTLANVSYTYDGLGRVKTTTRGNGVVTTNSYTPNNLLATQTTSDKSGNQVEAHKYTYDSHHNLISKTDTTAKPAKCTAPCTASPSTFGTWTTTYGYDAFNRLINSAVYSGSTATGTPVTKLVYTLDVSGNITTTTRTTRPAPVLAPTTLVTNDTVDVTGQLTTRKAGSTTTSQSFDGDGRVLTALSGTSTTYRPDGLPATATKGQATTTFSYWPDGTRRRAATSDPANGNSSVEFHYLADGTLVNDTTTATSGTRSASATASYLLTTGREARTLQPGTSPAGKITLSAAPVTTGAGVGYVLRDRHSSVTALVDSSGAVTNTYAYSDYGAPALLDGRSGRVTGALGGTSPGTTNPLQYAGAMLKAMYTDAQLGTLSTPARTYDPNQGRFLTRDVAHLHNRYVAFDTNPIMNLDPTGRASILDLILDAVFAAVFVISAVVTGGLAAAAEGVLFGTAEAAAEVTTATVASFVGNSVATVGNLVGAATTGTRLADDIEKQTGGTGFLSDQQRSDLAIAAGVAGGVSALSGGIAAAGMSAVGASADVVDDVPDFIDVNTSDEDGTEDLSYTEEEADPGDGYDAWSDEEGPGVRTEDTDGYQSSGDNDAPYKRWAMHNSSDLDQYANWNKGGTVQPSGQPVVQEAGTYSLPDSPWASHADVLDAPWAGKTPGWENQLTAGKLRFRSFVWDLQGWGDEVINGDPILNQFRDATEVEQSGEFVPEYPGQNVWEDAEGMSADSDPELDALLRSDS